MKNKLFAVSALIIGSLMVMTSYETFETATGSVSVKTTINGAPVAEVLVGISASAEDRENSKYIAEKETDSKGMITFSALNPGIYYLDAGFTNDDDESFYAEAKVTVADTKVDITIALEVESEDEEDEE